MNKHYYITTYTCTMELFLTRKGFNLNLIESEIPLDDELLMKHELIPKPTSVITNKINLESFNDEESYNKRVLELYEKRGKNYETLEEFIDRNKVSVPVDIGRFRYLGVTYAHRAVKLEGLCPDCGLESLYCTHWAVGMNDPGQVFTHSCFACLKVLKDYDTSNMELDDCPFCGHEWYPKKK